MAQSPALGLIVLIASAAVVFTVVGTGFLSSFNLNSLTQLAAEDIVIGFAQAAMIVIGRMNLAVGGIAAIVGAVCGSLFAFTGLPLFAILIIDLVVGAAAGAVLSLVEFRSGLNSFIVTLAFFSVYSGGVLIFTQAVHFRIPSKALVAFGNGDLGTPFLSSLVAVALLVAATLWMFYFRTSAGWKSLAIGANERAAAASGINVKRVVLLGYTVSGVLCAIAAIMEMARVGEASPALGSSWLFPSFIGPVLGGIALTGGVMSIAGVILGALFYDSLSSGLVLIGVPTYWLGLAQGAVLLGALAFAQLRNIRTVSAHRSRAAGNA